MKVKNYIIVHKDEGTYALDVDFNYMFSPAISIEVAISEYHPNRKFFKKTYIGTEKYWFDERFDDLTIEESAKWIFEIWYAEYSACWKRNKRANDFMKGRS